MEDAIDRSDIEVIELDDREEQRAAYSPEKLIGVAVLGALTSLTVYYLYQQLDPERRDRIKSSLFSALKGQVRRWGEEDA